MIFVKTSRLTLAIGNGLSWSPTLGEKTHESHCSSLPPLPAVHLCASARSFAYQRSLAPGGELRQMFQRLLGADPARSSISIEPQLWPMSPVRCKCPAASVSPSRSVPSMNGEMQGIPSLPTTAISANYAVSKMPYCAARSAPIGGWEAILLPSSGCMIA